MKATVTGIECADCGMPTGHTFATNLPVLCDQCVKLREGKRLRERYSPLKAWLMHAVLNLSAALVALWYGIVPPQWTGHDRRQLEELSDWTLREALREGFSTSERGE